MSGTATPTQDPALQTILLAVNTLYNDPDNAAKKRASEWLSEFQHSTEAWQTSHTLLTAPEIGMEARMIGAQTLRSKVLYDLSELPPDAHESLRTSFLQSLRTYAPQQGYRPLLRQLCLCIIDMAYQTPSWSGREFISLMIEEFGSKGDERSVGVLLEFLQLLVEEAGNSRIPISSQQINERCAELVSGQTEKVLGLLAMYIQAPGVTSKIQQDCFGTLRAWLTAGEVSALSISQTPLFDFAFQAIHSPEHFDSAVEVIVDLIHETQEVQDNVEVIQMIVPRVMALHPLVKANEEDPDMIRGLCRIFAEAGETYRQLILQHPQTFLPLVEAISECAAYPDLDIVNITFNFWYRLAQSLAKQEGNDELLAPFLGVYAKLQDDMIVHLRFPADDEETTAAEKDEFRAFRHAMGDVLKDCCSVLGSSVCLKRSYDLVSTAMANITPGSGPGTEGFVWQHIEAPLFSMRAMGAQVDPSEDEILPHIMDLLPSLPEHNKIRYAAILVISRYTEWVDQHPSYLPFQLNYISAGFEIVEDDVSAAAAQAMKFLCQDCKQHLIPYLDQLYSFITTAGAKLPIEDRLEVSEAIAYVICGMEPAQAASALQRFCEPLITIVQALAVTQHRPSREEMEPALEAMEQLEAYLHVIGAIDPFPESCSNSAAAIYAVFDMLLEKFNASYSVSDRACRVLRRGLSFFPGSVIYPTIPQLVGRLTTSFESSGHSSFVWIVSRVINSTDKLGQRADQLKPTYATALERITTHVKQLETTMEAKNIPDVFEDFIQTLRALHKKVPDLFYASPSLTTIVDLIITSLTLPALDLIMSSLELLADMLETTSKEPAALNLLRPILNQQGQRLVSLILQGLIDGFPEDSLEAVIDITVALCQACPHELQAWIGNTVQALPGHLLPAAAKQEFLASIQEAFAKSDLPKVSNAIKVYLRSARRTRERKERLSVGGH